MNTAQDAASETADAPQHIDLYWRPGCGFCSGLRRGLDKLGVDRVEHNIWDDPNGAAIVRQHAKGSETVPTVVIGDTGIVNPSPKQLLGFLAVNAPHLLPAGFEATAAAGSGSGKVSRIVGRVLGN
jgi:mycoredoxin